LTPGSGDFDVILLKNGLPVITGDFSRTRFPFELVEGMYARRRKEVLDLQAHGFGGFHSCFRLRLLRSERVLRVEFMSHLYASMRKIGPQYIE
jgi:hypothetical protein